MSYEHDEPLNQMAAAALKLRVRLESLEAELKLARDDKIVFNAWLCDQALENENLQAKYEAVCKELISERHEKSSMGENEEEVWHDKSSMGANGPRWGPEVMEIFKWTTQQIQPAPTSFLPRWEREGLLSKPIQPSAAGEPVWLLRARCQEIKRVLKIKRAQLANAHQAILHGNLHQQQSELECALMDAQASLAVEQPKANAVQIQQAKTELDADFEFGAGWYIQQLAIAVAHGLSAEDKIKYEKKVRKRVAQNAAEWYRNDSERLEYMAARAKVLDAALSAEPAWPQT
jgi:hypothetical protein